jgi:putative ABC transport system substrate-binding protein
MFYNPTTAPYYDIYIKPFETAAASLGIVATVVSVGDLAELESVMATQAREPNGGLVSMPGGFETSNYKEIVALAAHYRLPTVYSNIICARAGGLLAYSNDTSDNYYRAAAYVARILKGEKPADLPVQFPVKFLLLINAKTAKSLGLTVSRDMQLIADEVIE